MAERVQRRELLVLRNDRGGGRLIPAARTRTNVTFRPPLSSHAVESPADLGVIDTRELCNRAALLATCGNIDLSKHFCLNRTEIEINRVSIT